MKKILSSDDEHPLYYVYEIEAPEEYANILRKVAYSEHMTVEEMLVQGLKHIAAHPEVIGKWEAELNALQGVVKADFSRIHVRRIRPFYRDEIELEEHTGGAT